MLSNKVGEQLSKLFSVGRVEQTKIIAFNGQFRTLRRISGVNVLLFGFSLALITRLYKYRCPHEHSGFLITLNVIIV